MVISRESFKDSDGDKMMIIMYNGDHIQSFIILRERERDREIEREITEVCTRKSRALVSAV